MSVSEQLKEEIDMMQEMVGELKVVYINPESYARLCDELGQSKVDMIHGVVVKESEPNASPP